MRRFAPLVVLLILAGCDRGGPPAFEAASAYAYTLSVECSEACGDLPFSPFGPLRIEVVDGAVQSARLSPTPDDPSLTARLVEFALTLDELISLSRTATSVEYDLDDGYPSRVTVAPEGGGAPTVYTASDYESRSAPDSL